ncbi:hypothetical protein AB0B50_30290 [Streptomyces sp. NPDC041068]|uniref:hypothetical protein n=1 Tax=Streptomyces sp. NPDC041068 TaxID=3155130 RepID=UPI0033C5908B
MRRGVRNVLGAGAAVVCLGGLLAACGSESGDGYVATGAAGAAPERAPGKAVGPTGDVRLVPLDEAKASGGKGKEGRGGSSKAPSGAGSGEGSGEGDSEGKSPGSTDSSDTSATPGGASSPGNGTDSGRTEGGSGSSPSAPEKEKPGTSTPPAGPAELKVGAPEREAADKRWCEKVTVTFRNTGGSPVRSGTVTFGTHIIGALGVDWDTIESTVGLPAPIAPGEQKKKTWPVCVDAWRVPLGMHIETQDVDVTWK